ncbi:major facilitator superfamily domain-containing protein [Aspergillus heterothallicus]
MSQRNENQKERGEFTAKDLQESQVAQIAVSSEDDNYIRRAFDRRMLPIVCTLYILSYVDRGNIGNARTAGADLDLGLSSSQWAWVLNSFYIGYVLFEWGTLFWKMFPAHIFVAILCVLWGAVAMCSGVVKNMAGLVACRLLLGIFEAIFGAGAPFFLSLFYQRRELAFRIALLVGMSPVANCFAGALAYGITHIKGTSLEPWRLLFLIEGAPTVLFAPVVFFFLPDSPSQATFLPERLRPMAVDRLQTRDRSDKRHINWKHILEGLTDYRNVMHTFIHFMCNFSFAALSNFMPSIVQGMGYSSINAQGLTAPMYLLAFILCVLSAWFSDRYGHRGIVISVFSLVGMTGYLILATLTDATKPGGRYVGALLAACGAFPALCLNVTWLLNNNSSDSKRGAGLAILLVFGQCSSFLSSTVFPRSDGPFYVKGTAIGCGFTGSIAVFALAIYFRLRHINKKRDAEFGPVSVDAQVDVTEQGDNHPSYRYVL